jgi:hypothetical protein
MQRDQVYYAAITNLPIAMTRYSIPVDAKITVKTIKGSDYFVDNIPPESRRKAPARKLEQMHLKPSNKSSDGYKKTSFPQEFQIPKSFSDQFTDSIDDVADEFSSLTSALNLSSSLEIHDA